MVPAPSSPRSRSLARQLAVGVADQLVVAASSVLITVLLARSLAVDAFGAAAIVLLGRIFFIEISRAVAATPAQLGSDDTTAARPAAALAVCLGVLGLVVGVIGAMAAPSVAGLAIVIAAGLPAQLLLDVERHLLIARDGGVRALALDVVVLVGQLVGLAISVTAWPIGPVGHAAIWSIATGIAAVSGGWMLHLGSCSMQDAIVWWRHTVDVRRHLLVDALWGQAHRQGMVWLLGGFGSLAAVAGYRGAQTTFRPVALAVGAGRMVAVPSVRRTGDLGAAVAASSLATAIAIATLGVALLVPEPWGRAAFGETWDVLRPLLVPVGLAQIGQAASTGAHAGLVGSDRSDLMARLRATVVVGLLGAAATALVIDGPTTAIWTVGALSFAQVAIWWRALLLIDRPSTVVTSAEVTL